MAFECFIGGDGHPFGITNTVLTAIDDRHENIQLSERFVRANYVS